MYSTQYCTIQAAVTVVISASSSDMIISFRKTYSRPVLTTIKGAGIELVDSYKYLGIVLDNKLCFESHSASTTKKVQHRRFFLGKLFDLLPSSCRFKVPVMRTQVYKVSFVPAAAIDMIMVDII